MILQWSISLVISMPRSRTKRRPSAFWNRRENRKNSKWLKRRQRSYWLKPVPVPPQGPPLYEEIPRGHPLRLAYRLVFYDEKASGEGWNAEIWIRKLHERFAEIKRGWCELEVEVDPEEKEPTAEDLAKIVPFEWPDSD